MTDKTGGSAFPLATGWVETTGDRGQKIVVVRELDRGMSLRDYFASKVLEGLVADGILQDEPTTIRIANAAAVSYILADAMLAERAKCKT